MNAGRDKGKSNYRSIIGQLSGKVSQGVVFIGPWIL
jgi:hypothetical protein